MDLIIDGQAWLTITEAEAKYNLPTGSIRRDIRRGKLTKGTECRKIGKQWIINAEAARRLYGKRLEQE